MNIPILIVGSLAVIIAGFAFCRNGTQVAKKHSFQQDSTVLIKNGDSLIYELLIPKVDSFGEFPMTTVELKKANDKQTFIEFQPGGTETNILLFDTTSSSRLPGNSVVKKLDFGHEKNRTINISDFKAGIYYVSYGSCNIFGRYKLVIIDK
jgi:hypothetical protein